MQKLSRPAKDSAVMMMLSILFLSYTEAHLHARAGVNGQQLTQNFYITFRY
jgi:hypothetical protein